MHVFVCLSGSKRGEKMMPVMIVGVGVGVIGWMLNVVMKILFRPTMFPAE